MNKKLKKNAKLMKAILTVANILVALGALSLSAPAGAAQLAYVTEGAYGTCAEQSSLSSLTAVAQGSAPACAANATLNYFFDVLSSTGVTPWAEPVPVLVSANLGAGTSVMYGARAWASVELSNNPAVYVCSPCSPYTDLAPSFSGDFANTVYTGIGYDNRVQVIVSVDITTFGPAAAYAYADPYIRIDPAFQATHPDYYLDFSSNVTNAPLVPIPAAAWLFGSGLLGLIGVARRKRAYKSD
jgi:hypothetical protein